MCHLSATTNCFLHVKDKSASTDIQLSFQGDTQVNLFGFNGSYESWVQLHNMMYLGTRAIDTE